MKFKKGDIVRCSNNAKPHVWYHKKPMKIIGFSFSSGEYFTDMWGLDDPVDEDYLKLDKNYLRKEKLKRINKYNKKEEELNDFMDWLTDVWNPNQLIIPFKKDAAKAYIDYLKNKK